MGAPAAPDFATVSVEGLVKMYGTTRALAGVSATFAAGEVCVVEGPNGSGKSSLLQILAQLAKPTRGTVRYGGLPRAQARRSIALVAHAPLLYPQLSARQNLAFFGELYGLERSASERMLERFELTRLADRPVRTFSRGQLQRVALARALLASPALLLLDEPSTGLDVDATEKLVTIVDAERQRGAIVVCVTHSEDFAARIADRRLRLKRGQVVS
ncbi:MAG: heme ABC exporter ATP-binding protein CcmA [Myxococcota bacterium]